MKLLLDFGNTRIKAACRKDGGVEMLYCGPLSVESMERAVGGIDVDGGMYCTVRDLPHDILDWLDAHSILKLDHNTPIPVSIAYRTPHTLGMDRLAAVVGAWSIKPGNNLLVIDSGTAITYDFVSSDGCFVGGIIAPGLELRFRSLHEHTGRLPLLADSPAAAPLLGFDTETAIMSGVKNGIRFEIEGVVREIRKMYGPVLVFLTGGAADCFDMTGKSDIFAVSNLVMRGLDCILQYNETES